MMGIQKRPFAIMLQQAEKDTATHCRQVQGFHRDGRHWASDFTKPEGEQVFFQCFDSDRTSYEENHEAMMEKITQYKFEIVAEELLKYIKVGWK